VRLGFAVVAASEPELLITDEVLAVGDESFQKKCIKWIESFLQRGNTLLMVSHSMFMVQKLCQRALWLQHGHAQQIGDVFDVTQSYLAWHEEREAKEKRARDTGQGSGGIYRIETFGLEGFAADEAVALQAGDDLQVNLVLHTPDGRCPVGLVGIVRADGTPVYGVASDFDRVQPDQISPQLFRYRIKFKAIALLPGSYSIRGHAMDPEGLRLSDTVERRIRVVGESRELGFIRLPHEWL
jgi:lipopolysaccharide transport system ATP-binding protein